jgi:hypothetical protein
VRGERFFFFLFFLLFFLQALETAKSGLVLFHEATREFRTACLAESFRLFERAAAKGHEESIWILSVVQDVEMEKSAWKEAFAKTKESLGRYFEAELSELLCRERFDFLKKSAEGGCSWGQVGYGSYFRDGRFVGKDEKVYLEWLEKVANQNNPWAMDWLGDWFREEGVDKEKAVSYYRAAAELGWKRSMGWLAYMSRIGEGCAKDLRQVVIWRAKGDSLLFWEILRTARVSHEKGTTERMTCDLDQLCYTLGWGLYWYLYGRDEWNRQIVEAKAFGNHCLDFYCSCVELQQKSIFTFLLCWNQTTGGVKGPGQMIAQMVWEQREDNLVTPFEESDGEEPEMKRIKK